MAEDALTKPLDHHESPRGGGFHLSLDGKHLAEMTYTREGSTLTIVHTKVDPSLEGKGVAKRLVQAAVDWARRDGLKIIPVCPYAKVQFDRHPDWNDIRAA